MASNIQRNFECKRIIIDIERLSLSFLKEMSSQMEWDFSSYSCNPSLHSLIAAAYFQHFFKSSVTSFHFWSNFSLFLRIAFILMQ